MDRSANNNYARSRLDVVLAENKQLKKRLEVCERDNRELKLSVYELSARLSAALARNHGANGHPAGSEPQPPHVTGVVSAEEMAAQVTQHVLSSDLASTPHSDGESASAAPPADGRHLAPSATLSGHAGAVYTVAFAPSGRLLASGSFDKSVRCWTLDEREPRETLSLQKHTHNVSTLAWSADARALLSGSYDHTVRLWDVEAAACNRSWHAPDAAFVQAVAWHPTSPHVLCAATTGRALLLFDVRRPGDAPAAQLANGAMVNACLFLPAGDHILTGDKHGALKVWDLRSQSCVAGRYCGEARKPISHVALSAPVPHASRAAAYAGVGASLSGGGLFGGINGYGSGGGGGGGAEPRLLAVNSYDDTLRVYDRGYAPLEAFVPPPEDGSSPLDEGGASPGAESPKTRGSGRDGEATTSHSTHDSEVGGISSPGAGTGGGGVHHHNGAAANEHANGGRVGGVLEIDENDTDGAVPPCLHALVGHRNRSYPIRSAMRVGAEYARGGPAARRAAVVDVSTHDDDDRRGVGGFVAADAASAAPAPSVHSTVLLATGSADGDACVFDIGSGGGELVQRLRGHTDRVYAVDFHPSEPLLASGSADFTVRLWAPPPKSQRAKPRLTRPAFVS